jgi:hypothetical protein
MADSRRNDFVVGFKITVVFGKAAQGFGDVVGDRGFFGNDECFGHDIEGRGTTWRREVRGCKGW